MLAVNYYVTGFGSIKRTLLVGVSTWQGYKKNLKSYLAKTSLGKTTSSERWAKQEGTGAGMMRYSVFQDMAFTYSSKGLGRTI